jgi:hypothetical protein
MGSINHQKTLMDGDLLPLERNPERAMKVGQDIDVKRAGWTFAGDVADTFVEHIRRSIPYYDAGHDLICQLSDFFCHRIASATRSASPPASCCESWPSIKRRSRPSNGSASIRSSR